MKKLLFSYLLLLATFCFSQDYYRNWHVQIDTKKDKIALVVANNHYQSGGRLEKPIPTAKKLERALKAKGLDVLMGHDLSRDQFVEVIADFSRKLKNYQFGMIFYLGHGFQIDGENYLIPIDANPQSKLDVEVEAINIDYLLKKLNDPRKPKVIVLDACRDNPFEQNWASSERGSVKDGLADLNAPTNVEIFFTTQKDSKVRDDNPYLNYFMEEFDKGGCLDDMVRKVSRRIYRYNAQQIPAKYGQLFDEVCFNNAQPKPKPKPFPTPNPNPNPVNPKYDVSEVTIKGWNEKALQYYNLQNYTEASIWYQKSANAGSALGQTNLGWIQYLQKNYAGAFSWTKKAAEQGFDVGQNNLGFMYEYGYGVTQDYTKAANWYRKAANQGYAMAQDNLGLRYWFGVGAPKDNKQAVYWYRQAADQGYARAQSNLGFMYEYGHGVPQDYKQAVYWYSKSADQGYALGQANLGNMYYYGRGTILDKIQARYWWQQACNQGNQTACDNLRNY